MSWYTDPQQHNRELGSVPGRYPGSSLPPISPTSMSGWQGPGQQLPAVTTAFAPHLAFPNITGTLPSPIPLGQHPPSTSYLHNDARPGEANYQHEAVFPGIHAGERAHISQKSWSQEANDRNPQGIGQTRQGPSRTPRTRQPGEAQWQKNKKHIEKLYMKDGLPLPTVVKRMEEDHGFHATEKMYKNKFKVWRWSKNLSHEQAKWMSENIKQRQPTATVFQWNHQQWSEDKVMQICGRLAQVQPQTTGPVSYAGTPSEMKDIQYWTPRAVAETPQTPRDVAAAKDEHREQQQSHPIPRRFYLDSPPVNLDMKRTTISELHELLEQASRNASSGKQDEADVDFRDAVSGFRQLLSPTHEETIKAGYKYACFYASSGRMDKADAVLSWMTEKHRDKWGSEHEKTYLHYARMIELLRSWGSKEHAENLVYKLLEGLDDDEEVFLHFNDLSGPQNRRLLENADGLADAFPETDDVDTIRHQLNKIDLAVMTDIKGLDGILQTVIRHCDEGGSGELALQACRARCALAQRLLLEGRTGDAVRVLKSGRTSLARPLEVGEDPIARSTVEVARRLAFTFFEAKDEKSCNGVIDDVIMALETRLSLPDFRGDKLEKHALIDFVVSTAFYFHEKSAWNNCRYWIERALALAMKRFGRKSRVVLRLQRILLKEDLHMRTPASLTDLMGYSRGRCIAFPDERSLLFLPHF
ncbi:hypothetical protein QBC34DRAFT_434318 [Podospora aff. communis PSN243]|uniref:Clr5 domain-containing protein n=1 Tax=Podospora aff. communis PSN243 TaxID=3040156 RepID=A0AAV9H0S8_9PEZI|nr:hypothetical protein QBC34DRAFT_434318 [Podospora aff. communis PSN243]